MILVEGHFYLVICSQRTRAEADQNQLHMHLFYAPLLITNIAFANIQYQTQWTVNNPTAVAVGPSGDVYVASASNNLVQVFDSAGNPVTQWAVTNPAAVAVSSTGDVYVAGNGLIQVFDSAGNPVAQWAVTNPAAVAVSSTGDVYVAGNGLIQVFDSTGNPITQWAVINPVAIAINSTGDVDVAGDGLIQVFDSTGNPVVAPWECINATGIAIDPSGSVYVVINESLGSFIEVFTSIGDYLDYFESINICEGCLNNPIGISIDQLGNVFIVNMGNSQIQKFLIYHTITATLIGTGGTISPVGIVTKNSGDSQTYTITPNAGYRIASVKVNGFERGALTSYTFDNIITNHTITASFTPNTYTITATLIGTGGTISPVGIVTKNSGDSQTYTITPNAGYRIASVKVNGFERGALTSYTFDNIITNHTITASFTPNTYTITATLIGTGGTISPVGIVTKNSGDSQTYTITPNAGYRIASVKVNGFNRGAISTFTFNDINRNNTISATFTSDTYSIKSSTGANGTISPVGIVTKNSGNTPILIPSRLMPDTESPVLKSMALIGARYRLSHSTTSTGITRYRQLLHRTPTPLSLQPEPTAPSRRWV